MDKEVKSLIKAVIIASKGGVPLNDINGDNKIFSVDS